MMHKLTTQRALQTITTPFDTLCPFLYQTRTISNWQNLRSPQPSYPRHTAQYDDDKDTLSFLQRKAQDVEARRSRDSSLTTTERRTFVNIMKKFGARIDGIALSSAESSLSSRARLFDSESGGGLIIPTETPMTRATNTNIDDILSLFAPSEAPERFATFSGDDTTSDMETNPQPVQSTTQDIRKAAMVSLEYISHQLQTALASSTTHPDVAVWNFFESDILPLITLLRPTKPSSNQNPNEVTLAQLPSSENLPASLSHIDSDIPLLPLITILYPAATLLVLRTYISRLPASGYALALFPRIRSLGPISYLLAGNTHLFNDLLYLHWTVYSDLRAISQLLGEMKRNGVEYDQNTIAQFRKMQLEKNVVMRGWDGDDCGRSREWWGMKIQEDAWRTVARRYKLDVVGAKAQGKKNKGATGDEEEDNEIDLEIM